MLVQTLSQYLGSHKRLVIPQLGTFIVKEPGVSIVFSELLKRDDGVLRSLLHSAGMGELEAAGEIDRFVFEVRHAVEHGQEYRMGDFGVMMPGPNGTINFVYEPQPFTSEPETQSVSETSSAPESRSGAAEATIAEPKVSTSVKMNPDPSVRGLRYGKPPKNTNAYTYVDRKPRRRTDRFIWIALLAVAIALAAIAFGYFREAHDKEIEMEYIDQPVDMPVEVIPEEGQAQ